MKSHHSDKSKTQQVALFYLLDNMSFHSQPSAFVTGSLTPQLPLSDRRFQSRSTCVNTGHTPVYMGRRSDKIKGRKDAQTMAKTKIFARIG